MKVRLAKTHKDPLDRLIHPQPPKSKCIIISDIPKDTEDVVLDFLQGLFDVRTNGEEIIVFPIFLKSKLNERGEE